MEMEEKQSRNNIIKNVQYFFISLGFIYLIGWARISILFLLRKIFLNRRFTLSNIFTYIIYSIMHSLPNFIFFTILGFLIPFVILEKEYYWGIIIGIIYTTLSIMNLSITNYSTSYIIEKLIEIWIPYIIITPSIIFGIFLKKKFLTQNSE
jgi:hypothetical protein